MTVYGFDFIKMDDGDYVLSNRVDDEMFIILSKYDLRMLNEIIDKELAKDNENE